MWKLLRIIFVIKVHFIYGKLVGDHICFAEESHLVNVTENYVRNITVRHYQWCYNVPPRCSYYTVKEISDTRIVEKNRTLTIETCCTGFMEKDDKCIRNCLKCEYGECVDGNCSCTAGFKGNSCDVACDVGEWGLNCSQKCQCDNSVCNQKTGLCSEREKENKSEIVVQEALTTNEISTTVSTIPMNKIETESINSYDESHFKDNDNKSTFSKDGNSAETSQKKLEISTIYHKLDNTNPTLTSYLGTRKNYNDAHLVTDQSEKHINSHSIDTLNDVEKANHPYKNSNSSTNIHKNIAGTKQPDTETVLEAPLEPFKSSTESTYTNKSQFNDSNEGFLIPVGIKYDQLQNSQPKNRIVPTTSNGRSEDYMLVPREGFTKKHDPSDGEVSMNSLTVVVISIFIVIVLVVAIMIVSYTRSKRKEKLQKEGGSAAVSFIATSIFHKPLPDPPIIENPMYLTPVGYRRGITEAPTFETTIFCNFNSPNRPISDCREYLYDHPPSTGSYRAASSIGPLDENRTSISEDTEPLYDEIRYREDNDQTYEGAYQYPKPLSIYINTFGKTKF